MVPKIVFLVFLLPVILSIPIASFVLLGALDTFDRKLDMWPIKSHLGGASADFAQMHDYSQLAPFTLIGANSDSGSVLL